MDLLTIGTNAPWGGSAVNINENFSRLDVEVEKLKLATVSFKGYFSDLNSLMLAVPLPQLGDYAWVGSPFPGIVYKCQVAGQWVSTGQAPTVPSVDLNNWTQQDW